MELPSSEGLNIYIIECSGKGVRLVHHTYNPDGGTWSASPIDKQLKYIELDDNNKEIHAINISQSYGKKDKLFLINTNLLKSIEIGYSFEPHDHKHSAHSKNVKKYNYTAYNNSLKHIILQNQFKFWKSSYELPNLKGENIYNISVQNGNKVRLCHNSFNPDGHTCSAPPSRNQERYIDLYEGHHKLKLYIEEHFGERDKITLINSSFKNSVQINYIIEQITEDYETENSI